jgi:hypothetical protein
MDIETALAEAERLLQTVKEQEKRTLETLTGYGQEALDKVRDSFKKTIADAETRLAELRERFRQ